MSEGMKAIQNEGHGGQQGRFGKFPCPLHKHAQCGDVLLSPDKVAFPSLAFAGLAKVAMLCVREGPR